MLDGEGQSGPDTGDTPQDGEAKTTLTGDEAVLAELQSKLEAEEVDTGVGDDQTGGDQSEDELEDYEHGGKAYKVPKALKGHLMREADYTRSKQEIATEKKAIEAEREAAKAATKLDQELLGDTFKLHTIKERLAALQNLTTAQWAEIETKNAAQASRLTRELTLLKTQHDTLEGEIRQKQHQALETQRFETAKRAEDSLARIAKKIPGWSDDLAGKLNEYATGNGFSLDELQGFIPKKNADAYVSTLHKAYLFDQLMARTRAKPSTKVEATPVPVPKVGSRRAPVSSAEPLDSDPPDVWLKKRNKQLQASGGR